MKKIIAIVSVSLSLSAFAGEEKIMLKEAAGKQVVLSNCIGCHSLDYIQINSPFQNKESWTKTVDKMINVMKAKISDQDKATIIDYLTANYGK